MIVLLNCSTSYCQNEQDTIPSTGELTAAPDSILIAYDDLRKANAKMVELKYEKEVNAALRSIVENDDRIIGEYASVNNTLTQQIISYKTQRDKAVRGGIFATLSLVIAIIIK